MKFNAPDHFSHSFELKLNNLPTKKSDRIALSILYPGLFFGAVLAALGFYELCNGFKPVPEYFAKTNETAVIDSFISPQVFDIVIIILGLGIVFSLFISYIRYKKILFDGKTVEVIHRPFWGKKISFKEKLSKYEGVRFRIEFFQFGILTKNKYIIELLHKNNNKTVPLYISTSGRNIRHIWKDYARALNLPALMMSDEGTVARKVEDLDKSIQQQVDEGLIPNTYDDRSPLPLPLALVRKRDKTVIKARKIIWDGYNILAWIAIVMFGSLLIATGFLYVTLNNLWLALLYLLGILGIMTAVLILFRKDKMVIKRHKIVIVHKFMIFSRKNNEMPKAEIESIDISFSPATERYFLTISSKNKALIFGKKQSPETLRWVKQFLINDIIRK